MKTIAKLFLFVILLGIVFLNTTCTNNKWFATINIEGYVYDSLGGKPVQGIPVVLEACQRGMQKNECDSYTVGQNTTDISGHFRIHDNAARSNRYSLLVDGYIQIGGFSYSATASDIQKNCAKIYLK